MEKKKVSKDTKMMVYIMTYRPVLVFGAESLVLTRDLKSKIQAAYFRKVKGIIRRERLKIEEVEEKLNVGTGSSKNQN